MPVRIKYLPSNPRGRDLVVGDIHGQRGVLDRLLGSIAFDPAHDRLFATGDIVNRGPDSFQCASLCGEAWFESVLGNHEQACIDIARDPLAAEHLDIARNLGAEWLYRNGAQDVVTAFEELPHIIVVGSGATRFNIVHADLLQAGLDADELIDHMPSFEADSVVHDLIYSTSAFDHLQAKEEPFQPLYLSPTFCGHMSVRQVCSWGKHVFLDTGCGLGNAPLSGVLVQENRIVSAKPGAARATIKSFSLGI